MARQEQIIWFKDLSMGDVESVGGKNASLGEMLQHLTKAGVHVPNGFATTVAAYQYFLTHNHLDKQINAALSGLDSNDIKALTQAGAHIRQLIMAAELPAELVTAISFAYQQLAEAGETNLAVAVRSSATAEDLPDASFAGQQETFLNVQGIEHVLLAVKRVFASLFNDRAIAYRIHQGYAQHKIALSAGIQRMVRSDLASSGVMFTLDTESGFREVVLINAAYGLGETVVQGAVNPDEFYVYKPNLVKGSPAILRRSLGSKLIKMVYAEPSANSQHPVAQLEVTERERQQFCLTDNEIQQLAQYALLIEQHYGKPMDIEWAKDGVDGKLYIVQARPETVKSREHKPVAERYQLRERGEIRTQGRSVGQRIGQGQARLILDIHAMEELQPGEILVTDMTDPDWEPIMKRAAAIVTNRGGRTCHAAIIARELGIPAVVGCGDATQQLQTGEWLTVSCAEGETGYVYAGKLQYEVTQANMAAVNELPVKVMLNVGNPEHAFTFRNTPNAGVGLARLEFMISQSIGIHPKALLNYANLNPELQAAITRKTAGYASPVDFYVEKLSEGIATLAAAFYPKPVIVRLSDFKSNEYAHLLGGQEYEPDEENPMLGFRGAARYISPAFADCFALECQAVRYVREAMGLTNVEVMIPFVRTLSEAQQVVEVLAQHGLRSGKNGLRLIMMCEIPSNALLAEQFLEYFDGFSIGSNDLTQLTLGLDRDSAIVAQQFDERDLAVKVLLQQAITAAKKAGKYVGICGQGPSDHKDFARWLVEMGIESISLNPDSVVDTVEYLAAVRF